jgi:S-DNA-T family DNA segregation ATPase FtsK/SpoIIIE
LAGVLWLVHGNVVSLWQRAFGLILLAACTSASVHLIAAGGGNTLPEGPGGLVGHALANFLFDAFKTWGTVLVLVYATVVGLLLTAEGWVLRLPTIVKHVGKASGQALVLARAVSAPLMPKPATVGATADRLDRLDEQPPRGRPRLTSRDDLAPADDEEARQRATAVADPASESDPEIVRPPVDKAVSEAAPAAGSRTSAANVPASNELPARELQNQKAGGARHADAGKSGLRGPAIVNFPRPIPPPPAGEAYPRPIENWEFPPLALLVDPEYSFSAQQETIVRAKAKTLERTLEEFRLDAHVVEIDTGPVITMFELQLAPGIKVSQVASLSADIARALKAPAVRIVAPLPGKNTVGVEVPNVDKEKVRFKELITLTGSKAAHMELPLFLGKDAGGAPLVYDLAVMPHMLIAGTTGSGKSVCINSIIMSLLVTQQPDRCKMILVDPKMVEMSLFKDVPHLMCPIITEMSRAEQILDWAVTKMDERYELLAEAGARNLAAFNKMTAEEIYARFQPTTEEEKKQIPLHLPHVVIIIDELADLMMTSAKEVEHHLSRLAQKSRAVGIHIVVATQRPEAKVVTGLIKSNLPCRIAFRVASRMDSRIVLDQNGAEVLMGQGDMLFLPPGSSKLLRAQGTFLEDSELHSVINFLTERAQPQFHPQLLRVASRSPDGASGARDPLFEQAVEIMLETRRGSVSLLQRRLAVGYSRASRLIDQMAQAGIVGEYKGSQAREVVITAEEWQHIKAQLATDLQAGYAADEDHDGVPALTDDHDIID